MVFRKSFTHFLQKFSCNVSFHILRKWRIEPCGLLASEPLPGGACGGRGLVPELVLVPGLVQGGLVRGGAAELKISLFDDKSDNRFCSASGIFFFILLG